jgi:hypothetical protein
VTSTTTDPLAVAGHSDPVLRLAQLDDDARTRRDAKAVAYLKASGNADLLEVRGLVEAQRAPGVLDMPCPTCQATPGNRCRNKQGAEAQQLHRTRYRLAGRERGY